MKPPPPLRLEVRRSRYTLLLTVVLHAVTALLLASLPLPVSARVAGSVAIALACGIALRSIIGPAAPALLRVGIDRRIGVTARSGWTREGDVLADSYVGERLTTVVWRPDSARRARTLLIMADTLAADDFRRLRVVLRYGRAVEPGTPTSGVEAS